MKIVAVNQKLTIRLVGIFFKIEGINRFSLDIRKGNTYVGGRK